MIDSGLVYHLSLCPGVALSIGLKAEQLTMLCMNGLRSPLSEDEYPGVHMAAVNHLPSGSAYIDQLVVKLKSEDQDEVAPLPR
jgi:hypothetical protein